MLSVATLQVDALAESGKVNPIRRVINMLQIMSKKIETEGSREQQLFEKFMCYCDNGEGDLTKSVQAAETKVPQLKSNIDETTAEKTKLKGELEQAKGDRDDSKKTLKESQSLRGRSASAFADQATETKTNIESIKKAVSALRKGVASGFLQTQAATVLRSLTVSLEMSGSDREMLSSFLSGKQHDSDGYAPQSLEVVGMLEQMRETMEKDLADATATEKKAITDFNEMSLAKEAQIQALMKMIEAKTARSGQLGVELVNLMDDLDDTSTSLEQDKQFLGSMTKDCSHKKAEWSIRQQTRTDELLAISQTVKLLNDDDATNLFKKTLASTPSLIQLQVSSRQLKREALDVLREASSRHPSTHLDLLSLALRAKKTSFEKILKMIDEMVELLAREQTDDDSKKDYCRQEISESNDKVKGLRVDVDDSTKVLEDLKEKSLTLVEDINALTDSIHQLDKQVSEATVTRKEEHQEFVSTLTSNNAAQQLLAAAKMRLNKFYNPSLALAQVPASGSTLAAFLMDSLNAPSSFLQMRVKVREEPSAAPETYGKYKKQNAGNNIVLQFLGTIIADLDKDTTEMNVDERDAQQTYQDLLKKSAQKRTLSAKSITEKEGAKADLEERLHKLKVEQKGFQKEVVDTLEYLKNVHNECDWLLANFDVRKQARADERESLMKAQAVLSGADDDAAQQ